MFQQIDSVFTGPRFSAVPNLYEKGDVFNPVEPRADGHIGFAAIDRAAADPVLKEIYASGLFHSSAYEKNPGMAVAKKVKITGRHYDFAVKFGQAANRSRTASTALAKTNTINAAQFQMVTARSFDAKDVDQQALAEVTDEGAFVDLLTSTMDDLAKSMGNGLGEDLFLNTGASIGVVGTVVTTLLTLANPSNITRFYVGQTIASASTDGTSGALDAGSVVVTQVDRDAGTLTAAANWTAGIAAIAAGRFLFNAGDFGLGRAGLPSWVPDVTTGLSVSFFNVVRNVDVNRLAGSRQSVTTGTDIVSALRSLLARMGREEASVDQALCSFEMLADLETQIEQKVVVSVQGKGVDMGFDAIRIVTGGRRVDFIPDRSCGDDRIYVGDSGQLELIYSQDDPITIDDKDGEVLSRNATSYSYDVRASSYSNYVIREPRGWGVLIFT